MRFKDIAGHTQIKKKLIGTILNQRVSHAQLFVGPSGNGKLALAIAYAQYLACENRTEQDSCGECAPCKKISKLVHPDLHFIFPVVKTKKISKPVSDNYLPQWRDFITQTPYHSLESWLDFIGTENQQAGIFAHESQEIIRKLNLKTFEAEYKVMIIWKPEKMNISASNKLLKMIEEPPPKTVFILVSQYPDQIIQTILSRTQLFKIPKIDRESMSTTLKAKFNAFSDQKIEDIVRLADGNYIKATKEIKNYDVQEESENFKNFAAIMRYAFGVKVLELITLTEEIAKQGREHHKFFLEYSLKMLRETFILNISPENKNKIVYLAKKEAEFAQKFSPFIHKNNINQLSQEFNLALRHIERNGNSKMILLDLALKITRLIKIKP